MVCKGLIISRKKNITAVVHLNFARDIDVNSKHGMKFVRQLCVSENLSFGLPLLSDRLYFFDNTPSVLMLHVEIYGTQACCP